MQDERSALELCVPGLQQNQGWTDSEAQSSLQDDHLRNAETTKPASQADYEYVTNFIW